MHTKYLMISEENDFANFLLLNCNEPFKYFRLQISVEIFVLLGVKGLR